MPFFELDGYGKKTGRKRHQKFEARDADHAIMLASDEDTIVDTESVKRCYPMSHTFETVAGTKFKNNDGSSRQKVIAGCARHEQVGIVRELGNPHSDHAVKVFRLSGGQCGYLPDDLAEDVTDSLNAGKFVVAIIDQITSWDDGKLRGLGLLIVTVDDADTPLELVTAYCNEILDR